MKIEKIDKIKGHKIFHDFNWPTSLLGFNSRNIIYGWNASGKTTLSNILYALSKKEIVDEGIVKIDFDNGSLKGSEFCDFQLPIIIKVFNRKYVEANVYPTSGSVEPIYVVGDQNGAKDLEKYKILKNNINNKKLDIEDNKKKEIQRI